MPLEEICDHTLHPRFVNAASIVMDVGANRGAFSQAMIERFHCRCIALEPSPALFAQIAPSGLLEKHNVAIAGRSGPVSFHVSDVPVASSLAHRPPGTIETIEVAAKRLEEFSKEQGLQAIDVLKMDIEGAEVEVFDSCSDSFLGSVGQITVEFHDHVGLVSKPDILRVIDRLSRLGFLHFSKYLGSYYDTLFLNQARCPISSFEYSWNRHIVRNWRGLGRRLRKLAAART